MVKLELCKGNPGAIAFMAAAYKANPVKAEYAFERMQENGIDGCKLYMLWNDCCDRNTARAVQLMIEAPIEELIEHINYEGGRGIPFQTKRSEKEITLEDCLQLQERFKKYCETAEQHEFGILFIVDMKLGATIQVYKRSGEVKDQKNARAMFRSVLKVIGEDFSEYMEDGSE